MLPGEKPQSLVLEYLDSHSLASTNVQKWLAIMPQKYWGAGLLFW